MGRGVGWFKYRIGGIFVRFYCFFVIGVGLMSDYS